jgi:very-short-patch-repair endonuclease
MKNCHSCGELLEQQDLCWCGFDNATNQQVQCTANEEFVFVNTKTSHKRFESMVVYALHFALRDLELRSQYHVQVENNKYLIDLYSPALNLAIEIDESYHFHAEQKDKDDDREQQIKDELGCEFYRINCNKPIYEQVDRLIAFIKKKNYDIWQFQRPNYQKNSGEYSAKQWEKLEASGVIHEVENLRERFSKEFGFLLDSSPIKGIPSQSNGEYGFIVWSNNSPHKLAVYARATYLWHVRIVETDSPDEKFMKPAHLRKGIPRFYKILELEDGTDSIEKVLEVTLKWIS